MWSSVDRAFTETPLAMVKQFCETRETQSHYACVACSRANQAPQRHKFENQPCRNTKFKARGAICIWTFKIIYFGDEVLALSLIYGRLYELCGIHIHM